MGDGDGDGLGPVLRLPPNPGVRPPRLAATTGPSAATSDGGGGNGSGEDGGVTASSLKAAAERHFTVFGFETVFGYREQTIGLTNHHGLLQPI